MLCVFLQDSLGSWLRQLLAHHHLNPECTMRKISRWQNQALNMKIGICFKDFLEWIYLCLRLFLGPQVWNLSSQLQDLNFWIRSHLVWPSCKVKLPQKSCFVLTTVVLLFNVDQNHLEGFPQYRSLGPIPRGPVWVDLGYSPRSCIFNMFPGTDYCWSREYTLRSIAFQKTQYNSLPIPILIIFIIVTYWVILDCVELD